MAKYGAVMPGKVTDNTNSGEQNMSTETQNYELKAVLTEKETGKKSVVVSSSDGFYTDPTEAIRQFSMDYVDEIRTAEKKGRVDIKCRPFCE